MANYLHRFYPWQSFKLARRAIRLPNPNKQTLSAEKAIQSAQDIFTKIDAQELGFALQKKPSSIPHAGLGVYLQGKTQRQGSIVSFYPGTIYMPAEPIFFVSLGNQYILKCIDGLYVDGKPTGLSGHVYTSLFSRENWPGAIQISDKTWIKDKDLMNPLAIGQFVNNGTDLHHQANVYYQEIDLPITFPHKLRYLIPNMYWDAHMDPLSHSTMRIVALVALRDIHHDEELYSTYMDII